MRSGSSAHRRPDLLPRLAVTMGDPAGIGPELLCRVAADPMVSAAAEIVAIADPALLARVAEALDLTVPAVCEAPPGLSLVAATVVPGRVAADCGAAAMACVAHAVDGCLAGRFAGLVTAPINKAAIAAAGLEIPGHTEYLAERCGGVEVAMCLQGPELTVALVTCHQSLASVSASLERRRVVTVGRLLHGHLCRRLTAPRLALCGLNPHAGEGGLFGDEELRILEPAAADLRAAGIDVTGPLPSDTAFTPAARARFDGHICCYHDQALVPFKALHFDQGVNLTLGLPIVRASPDHGTAFDLAWQGRAAVTSMRAAVLAAAGA